MIEFKTTKGEYLLMELPDSGGVNFVVDMGYLIFKTPAYENWVTDAELANPAKLNKYLNRINGKDEWKQSAIKTPDGNYKLKAVTKSFVTAKHEASQNITEEIAGTIVGDNGMGCYDNYRLKKDEKYTCTTALSSFECLLMSLGGVKDKAYAVLEKL